MIEETLAEQIARQLRRDILRGKLAPGSSIKERDNAAEMGVSRTPMREAIRILAKEGLVILRPARSPIVAEPSIKEISDQVEVLLALEKLSAELACKNATEEDLAELERIQEYVDLNFDGSDPLDMFEVDMSFHSAIARASGNDVIADMHRTLLERLWRARYLAARRRRNRARVVLQHGAILDALKARDRVAALEAIEAHLGHLEHDIREVIEQEAEANMVSGTS
ncbi:GntR family transcriptional regulator [Donghicola tyrosinivorans]|jgi:DNA-binding GntR family transcriptional regulator|uniref:DNA-binding GntR family transcriptional regulator n=1 Tax=Donghicola tyrosinivorans TaxID=1652492 RepID=A0A2T0WJN8_9RHOB|nr:GntR family transcriptional regulator [Donghicola tyrosinivorans]PRY86885.1 DNA-binding GntR family transcriptional regulator [Donghicola tyrosinivorans]